MIDPFLYTETVNTGVVLNDTIDPSLLQQLPSDSRGAQDLPQLDPGVHNDSLLLEPTSTPARNGEDSSPATSMSAPIDTSDGMTPASNATDDDNPLLCCLRCKKKFRNLAAQRYVKNLFYPQKTFDSPKSQQTHETPRSKTLLPSRQVQKEIPG